MLVVAARADRHHDPAAGGELLAQGSRDARPAGRYQDGVVRRSLRPAAAAVGAMHGHVDVAEAGQPFARTVGEAGVAFDGIDVPRDQARDRTGIARAGTDVEDAVA